MTNKDEWWRGSITYQIYPRSFQDANEDGMGDLEGIAQRLPHVAELGVDAIWISPVFTSPMIDMGYDVADHRDIDPTFGTLEDFDRVVARAHDLGLKVIIDQVLSHSSDQHPLFQESRSSRTNPKHDWYVWADAKPEGSPPTNWQSIFGGPAWTWDVRRRQYYYHQFLKEQPDLNFHNPEVQDWALETLRFWLDRGVDGFRIDAANHIFHDEQLRDNPADYRPKTEPDYKTFEMQYPIYSKNRPENVAFLERMRAVLDEYDARVFIGEIGEGHHPVERLVEYTSGKRLHMAYNMEFMGKTFTPEHFRKQIDALFVDSPGGFPCWAFSNHDVPRHLSRWASYGADQDALAKLCAGILLSLEGSVCLYQGEELGLTDTDLNFEELVDPEGKTFWPDNKGRDPERTPMVWEEARPHAGFSAAASTWLPVKPPQQSRAVDTQIDDPQSVLNFYKQVVALRQATPALKTGRTRFLTSKGAILAFVREPGVICAFNLRDSKERLPITEVPETLLSSNGATVEDGAIILPPNGVFLGQLKGK
ncbi:alpha-glucosidase [Poseidonocella pacifica]|uniref:Alpha-glucosidase n=1 Tax=Poseidonocella pacifica TaxID=871651 RepID=A0A1I0WRP0_9RHOB|nr:alpha-glucosidase [Poseidonocella pacifica]SFA90643.1 alpha-glucosidase [Poseidonocella pacifica]